MQKSFASNMLCSVSYTTLNPCIPTSLLVKVPDQESEIFVPGIHVHPAGFLVPILVYSIAGNRNCSARI